MAKKPAEMKGNIMPNTAKTESEKYDCMLLGRLQQDCDYFLGAGGGDENRLWAGNIKDQIEEMKKIWNKIKEKPEWISLEDIEQYEQTMVSKIQINKHE